MRILAIDYGEKRVGTALSDPTGTLASPLRTLPNEGRRMLLEGLATIVVDKDVARVIVGLPIRTDGTWGPEAKRVLRFARQLETQVAVPVTWLNEAFTTSEALSRLRASGKRRDPRQERAIIDQIAACMLLEDYLADLPVEPLPLPSHEVSSE